MKEELRKPAHLTAGSYAFISAEGELTKRLVNVDLYEFLHWGHLEHRIKMFIQSDFRTHYKPVSCENFDDRIIASG